MATTTLVGKYNAFSLPRDLVTPRYRQAHMTLWVGARHSPHHPAKFSGLRDCGSGDKTFFVVEG